MRHDGLPSLARVAGAPKRPDIPAVAWQVDTRVLRAVAGHPSAPGLADLVVRDLRPKVVAPTARRAPAYTRPRRAAAGAAPTARRPAFLGTTTTPASPDRLAAFLPTSFLPRDLDSRGRPRPAKAADEATRPFDVRRAANAVVAPAVPGAGGPRPEAATPVPLDGADARRQAIGLTGAAAKAAKEPGATAGEEISAAVRPVAVGRARARLHLLSLDVGEHGRDDRDTVGRLDDARRLDHVGVVSLVPT